MKKLTILAGICLISLVIVAFGCSKEIKRTNSSGKKVQKQGENEHVDEFKFDRAPATKDPFNDASGPFYHKVYKAISKDGFNFDKAGEVILDKASVPGRMGHVLQKRSFA